MNGLSPRYLTMKIRYRKRKKTRVLWYSEYNFDAEPGDLMVSRFGDGKLYRLEDRKYGPMAALGELYPRLIHPPSKELKALRQGNEVYWVDENTYRKEYR